MSPFGKGRHKYVFTQYCKDADIELGDGTWRLFFYTDGIDKENISSTLLQLFVSVIQVGNNFGRVKTLH